MRLARTLVAIALVALPAAAADGGAKDPPHKNPECLHIRAYVVYGAAGYDHIVELKSACDRRATCQVSTNVAPQVLTVRVDAGKKVDVVTYRGSPASTFDAKVLCSLDG